MPDQVRATSKPLEQFLASHFFSPRNTRSTRKEVDKEGDEKVFRRSSTEIFASFRVFRGLSLKSDIDHGCWDLGRKRDMIASRTITTRASAPQMKRAGAARWGSGCTRRPGTGPGHRPARPGRPARTPGSRGRELDRRERTRGPVDSCTGRRGRGGGGGVQGADPPPSALRAATSPLAGRS